MQEPAELEGPWYNPILYKAVKSMWFNSPKDDGIVHSDYFDPMSPVTIALVFTAVGDLALR